MAKLKAPLLSLGATQQLGKTLVFFPWKGINAVREYVVPTNPNTQLQQDQRGYVTGAVSRIHAAMANATHPLGEVDKAAYSLWASVLGIIMTWFNAAVKNWVDQEVAGLDGCIYGGGVVTPGAAQIVVELYGYSGNLPTAGAFWYGTSKTALLSSQAAGVAGNAYTATIAGLTNGIKYYIQFRPSAPAALVGARSGIYHATPVA